LIIVERVEQVSLAYNPEELVEIGRPRYGETTWPGGKYVPQFMGAFFFLLSLATWPTHAC